MSKADRPDHPRAAERFNEEQATYAVRGADQPDLEQGVAAIREVLNTLPRRPGVYRMQDARGDVLYVGKARALKNRVTNYTQVTKLPKRLQPRAKRALHAMMYAESRAACLEGIAAFAAEYGAKYPKAVESLTREQEQLLTHFDFPAEHWPHLRTTNPIESTFATVKLRQRVTKGAGSRTAGLTMAFKLLLMAQTRWRRLNAPHLVAQVRAGVRFQDGVRLEREDAEDEVKTAA